MYMQAAFFLLYSTETQEASAFNIYMSPHPQQVRKNWTKAVASLRDWVSDKFLRAGIHDYKTHPIAANNEHGAQSANVYISLL